MTNTLKAAAELIADHARARGLRINQVDADLCEDNATVMFHAYASGDDCLTALADLPMRLESEGFLQNEWRDAFMGLLPGDLIATPEPA